MYEAIANPPKGKGKEKDVGKRRAYVRVVTSLGGGSLNLELFCEKVRATSYTCPFGLNNTTLIGSQNMLQLLDACPPRKVQRMPLSSPRTGIHGEPSNKYP